VTFEEVVEGARPALAPLLVTLPQACAAILLISFELEGVITAPQGSVPMAQPGQPHLAAQADTQLLLSRFRRAQAGPAITLGRTERKETTVAIKKKGEIRAIETSGYLVDRKRM